MSFYGRCYSLRNLYNLNPDTIKQTLDIKNLMNYEEYCRDAIKEIENIRREIAEQIPKLQEVQTKNYILVNRYKDYYNKIKVDVELVTETILDGHTRNSYQDRKTFTGTEKKQSLEYAEVLRKKHGFGIIKNNWR